VLHALSINQKGERVSYLKFLVIAGIEQDANGCHRIITRDELWSFFDYPRDSAWAALRDELSQRIKQKSDIEKCVVSIFRLVDGTHGLLDASKGTMYNAAFFTAAVMSNLIENVWPRTRRKTLKCWLIH
jgi:hypothetical protein